VLPPGEPAIQVGQRPPVAVVDMSADDGPDRSVAQQCLLHCGTQHQTVIGSTVDIDDDVVRGPADMDATIPDDRHRAVRRDRQRRSGRAGPAGLKVLQPNSAHADHAGRCRSADQRLDRRLAGDLGLDLHRPVHRLDRRADSAQR
jgi:hypothetical protein